MLSTVIQRPNRVAATRDWFKVEDRKKNTLTSP